MKNVYQPSTDAAYGPQPIRKLIPSLRIGKYPTGQRNDITDVRGVLVSTFSIHKPAAQGEHDIINTGVTAILPRKEIWDLACHAGIFSFNGAGEMTGSFMVDETGLLASPVVLTGTFGIGAVHEGALRHFVRDRRDERGLIPSFTLPVITETSDSRLTDVTAFPVRPEHVVDVLDRAASEPVEQGCTGGGTGMVCHGFKAGTGSASRVVPAPTRWEGDASSFVVAALVQANYGGMDQLRVGGVPVGLKFAHEHKKAADESRKQKNDGSIIVVVATDAPVLPLQLQRIAKRATVGLSRVGGTGANYSGDIFIAFSTAVKVPIMGRRTEGTTRELPAMLQDEDMNPFFEATADAVEEAIYNALCMGETMIGPFGKVDAIDRKTLKELVEPRLLHVDENTC